MKGQVIKVSQNSTQYINPMDINLNYSEGDTPIALKSDFILSFCELIMGGKNGLEAVEKTLIDRAVSQRVPQLPCRPEAGEYADFGGPL